MYSYHNKLPNLLAITGPDPQDKQLFLQRLDNTLQTNIKLIQLRTPGLPKDVYLDLVDATQALCMAYRATLILNPPVTNLILSKNTGLHLTSKHLMTLVNRPNFSLVGASCHNEQEIAQASKLQLNYILLSPVLTTASHPQAIPLGWRRFAELVAKTELPVYALGGLKKTDLLLAQQHGAHGIAAISSLWQQI